MTLIGTRPKPEDFPLYTAYTAAYMAWRKKGPQASQRREISCCGQEI
jgi:hypothetical protein